MLGNLIKIVAAVIGWLLSPQMRQKRRDDKAQERSDEIREEVNNNDADALTARIDRLLTKARNRAGQGKDGED
jgi:hypothetical protein